MAHHQPSSVDFPPLAGWKAEGLMPMTDATEGNGEQLWDEKRRGGGQGIRHLFRAPIANGQKRGAPTNDAR
ncbi:MAG: hypothetical protein LKKZDAJK_001099 [Candidatus Fervidibacter sp.]